ncbi:MAG: ribosome silencing factor [Bacteroidia bacterium]|nr:ribosome silencing factor [Bacteroidia bacterium]
MIQKITKQVTAKKIAVKKVAVKKVAAKKAVPAKKTAVKKVATPKKAAVKKTVAPKKVAAKKGAEKKTVVKKATIIKAVLPSKTSKKKKKVTVDNAELLVELIIIGMQEKKAQRITVLDLRDVENAVTDFFVISQAESTTQVDAIADSVWEEVRKNADEKPFHIEGKQASEWVLLDYVNVVAHVFQPDAREHYNLEKLWSEAVITRIKD